mmetsp:Transcript_15854/g.36705  ORF Transcript_15854/g.36705 Transcript_15854/m.36705 type:complete len:268 (+) Transcript_15854:145-948(+)
MPRLRPVFPREPNFGVDQESGELETIGSSAILTSSSKSEKPRYSFMPAISHTALNQQVTAIVAIFTIVLSIASMIVEGSAFAIISGIFSMIMGPYFHYQQIKIVKIAALKEQSEVLEKEIARLRGDNRRLSYDVDELDGRIEDLLDVEDALEIVSKAQSVDALQKDADSNLDLVCNMQQSVEGSVIEILFSSLYCRQGNVEIDLDAPITAEQTNQMIQRLKGVLGISIDEGRFRETFTGNPIESAIDAIRNLVDDDIPKLNRIFHIK